MALRQYLAKKETFSLEMKLNWKKAPCSNFTVDNEAPQNFVLWKGKCCDLINYEIKCSFYCRGLRTFFNFPLEYNPNLEGDMHALTFSDTRSGLEETINNSGGLVQEISLFKF